MKILCHSPLLLLSLVLNSGILNIEKAQVKSIFCVPVGTILCYRPAAHISSPFPFKM